MSVTWLHKNSSSLVKPIMRLCQLDFNSLVQRAATFQHKHPASIYSFCSLYLLYINVSLTSLSFIHFVLYYTISIFYIRGQTTSKFVSFYFVCTSIF